MALATAVFADPFFTEMDRAMNRFINSALNGSHPSSNASSARSSTSPATANIFPMDIFETSTAYELHADTPGMAPQDVKVELHEGLLIISGERKISHQSREAGSKVWRSERTSYSFSRSFTLPENANTEAITASVDKGVLSVTVPKKDPPAKPEPKRITVTGA